MKAASSNGLSGRVCLVTGANRGLGKARALELAKRGATVVMACRDSARGEAARREVEAATGNANIDLMLGDLSTQQSVRDIATAFKSKHDHLDVLVNNAGIFKNKRTLTPDGLEMMFATNHLGPFLLTNLLLGELKAAPHARILNVTAPSTTKLDFDDLQGEKSFKALTAFGASKMGNLLFTYELARRLDGTGVTVNAFHPGLMKSNLLNEMPSFGRWMFYLISADPERAGQELAYLVSSPDVEGVSGKFFKGRKIISSSAYSNDPGIQRRLWDISANLCKIESF